MSEDIIEIPVIEQNVGEIVNEIEFYGPEFTSMIRGSPGIGKTEALNDKFRNWEIDLVLAGCSEPTDIGGCPDRYFHNDKPVAMDILPPVWAWKASTIAPEEFQGPRLIFFDDISTAHEQTQAACFKIFGEKKVGNLYIRDNVHVIGAGNRVGDRSAVYEMPLALCNRVIHYYAVSDPDAWLAWATKANVHPLVIAYIRSRGDALDQFAEHIKSESTEEAFATPRTWVMLSKKMWKKASSGPVKDWVYAAGMGVIGTGPATAFRAFVQNATSLIPPEEIAKNPYEARIPHDIDALYATIAALEHYIKQKKNNKHWIDAVRYVLRDGIQIEYGVIIAKMAVDTAFDNLGEDGRAEAIGTQEFSDMLEKFGIVLDETEEDEKSES